ncbi:MAG TPA: phosphate ABC transporter ATP-binding protein PstB [Pseudomonadales bacterium]|nr:phosphate ABC transporter ATP-binding protein PstB [Pseudomonadales bacterium]
MADPRTTAPAARGASPAARGASPAAAEVCLEVEGLGLHYGDKTALNAIDLRILRHRVTAFIGPSGCGKSTLLRCFNRMNDLIDDVRIEGQIRLEGMDIRGAEVDPYALRRRVGMVFQKPNPFPKSVYENVAFGLRLDGMNRRVDLDDRIEWALRSAALWDEVKDRLQDNALSLSGGQQQRLVIARAIAIQPEVLLLDEPASALDPISTLKIEELIDQLAENYTILIVTHNMQQAARVSDFTAFLYMGDLVEFGTTDTMFTNPSRQRTEDYITGRYG